MSPLRGKRQVVDLRRGVIHANGDYESNPLTAQAGITARDRNDCMRADAVLFNLLGATERSVGTIMEFGWADAFRKPIVLAMEDAGNVHEHPMIRAISGFRVSNLDDAVAILTAVLMPEGEGTCRESAVGMTPLEFDGRELRVHRLDVDEATRANAPRKEGKLVELGYRQLPTAG